MADAVRGHQMFNAAPVLNGRIGPARAFKLPQTGVAGAMNVVNQGPEARVNHGH